MKAVSAKRHLSCWFLLMRLIVCSLSLLVFSWSSVFLCAALVSCSCVLPRFDPSLVCVTASAPLLVCFAACRWSCLWGNANTLWYVIWLIIRRYCVQRYILSLVTSNTCSMQFRLLRFINTIIIWCSIVRYHEHYNAQYIWKAGT